MDEIISADEAKGLLAEILSAKLGMEIEPGQIEFVFKKESRTVGFFTNEHTETVQVFQGIRIEKKDRIANTENIKAAYHEQLIFLS